MSRSSNKPRVGIGLPVYNGEKYLGTAIRSILEQSFENFELVIGDNASSDATEEICRSFESDPRVTYIRRERNLGATPNYNDLMERLQAPLVRWHASDDALAPTYLEACVALLDDDPNAPMAHAEAVVIDGDGETIGEWNRESKLRAEDPVDRWREVAFTPDFHSIFALVRREIVDKVGLFPIYPGSDRWVLGGWLLHGRPRCSDERLFIWRDHAETFRRTANRNMVDAEQWWSTDLKTWPMRNTVLGYGHGRRVISSSPLRSSDRSKCRRLLLKRLYRPVMRRFKSLFAR